MRTAIPPPHPLLLVVLFLVPACGGAGPSAGQPTTPPVEHDTDGLDAPLQYRLTVDGSGIRGTVWLPPQTAQLRVDLPDAPGRTTRRQSISEVHCGEQPVSEDGEGWLLPLGCEVLAWRVQSYSPGQGVDPRRLRALHNGQAGWWLLPGAAVFLLPEGLNERPNLSLSVPEGVTPRHNLPDADDLGLTLPAPSQIGRVTIGLGAFHERVTSDGAARLAHYVDQDVSVDLHGLSGGLDFLQSTLRVSLSQNLSVYWFAAADGARLEGAAGLDSAVVNYSAAETPDPTRAHLAVLFHQLFRSLAGPRLPEWMSLTLGQYYALRSWAASGAVNGDDVRAMFDGMALGGEPPITLLEAYRAFHDSGSAEDYDRLHVLGIAFWDAFDELIVDTGGIDSFAHELLELTYLDGYPPRRLVELLLARGVENPSELLERHLGLPSR